MNNVTKINTVKELIDLLARLPPEMLLKGTSSQGTYHVDTSCFVVGDINIPYTKRGQTPLPHDPLYALLIVDGEIQFGEYNDILDYVNYGAFYDREIG